MNYVPSPTEDPFPYSDRQYEVLNATPKVTGLISALSSGYLIFRILKERKTKLKGVYHRMILGMSCFDFVGSSSLVIFGKWAMPQEIPYIRGAKGTWATCEVAGFFTNFLLGTLLYSVFMSVYFLLLLRYQKNETWIANHVEKVFHAVPAIYVLFTGCFALAIDLYNPLVTNAGICLTIEYPWNCWADDNVDCIRPSNDMQGAALAFNIIVLVMAGLGLLVIIGSMVLVVLKVRETELKIQRYAGGQNQPLIRTRETGVQAMFYIGSFLFTWIPFFILSLSHERISLNGVFAVAFLFALITPLQGFFNASIYLRKQINAREIAGRVSNRISSVFKRRASSTQASSAQDLSGSGFGKSSNLSSGQQGQSSTLNQSNQTQSSTLDQSNRLQQSGP